MAKAIGRLGYLGIGIESTAGTPVSPSAFLQYSAISLKEMHEPIENIMSAASRIMDTDSVKGKQWGEGDFEGPLDVVRAGYLFKLALGSELLATGTPNSHTFFLGSTTISGNAPLSATLVQGRDTDVPQYAYACVDNLEVKIANEGLSMIKTSFMSQVPSAVAAPALTTTSGTVPTFKDTSLYLGATLSDAEGGSATPVQEFMVNIANNLELIYQTGSNSPTVIRTKGVKVTGSFTQYFDSVTERDAYMALTKRALSVTATGNVNEQIRIRVPKFRVEAAPIETGLDDFFVVQTSFVAEDSVALGTRLVDVRLQNSKSTAY